MCIPQSYENYGFCNYFLSYPAIPPRLSNCIVEEVCARGPCNGNAPSTCNNIPLYGNVFFVSLIHILQVKIIDDIKSYNKESV